MSDDELELACRVCRCGPEPDAPLFTPCKCSGWVHIPGRAGADKGPRVGDRCASGPGAGSWRVRGSRGGGLRPQFSHYVTLS